MKKNIFLFNLVIICLLSAAGCEGQALTEKGKIVRAYNPEMNNMEMLSMQQNPGWMLLAGTQWIGNSYCNTIKGVNEKLNSCFFIDGNRSYSQSPMAKSGTFDGKTVYLNLMSAVDYLDYVFHRQFPDVKNAKRTKLQTLDQYPEAERQQLEQQRIEIYNAAVNYQAQQPNGANYRVNKQTADRALAEYKWVQNGDTIVHSMEVIIGATFQDFRSAYFNTSIILWNQQTLWSVTTPVKNSKKVEKDIETMIPTMKFNEQYMAALNEIVMKGIRYNEQETQRIMNEMAQSEIRHQQNMSRQIQETNNYISKARNETFANRQASMERVNQGWTDVLRGVDRYVGTDGKVMEVPTNMGSNVWQSAEGGTIYTSDSYLFSPVANLPDKDGIVREFRQLQLLK